MTELATVEGMATDTWRSSLFTDPVWRVSVELTATEAELLRTWPVRRLAFVAHAGAASVVGPQTYSRLDHSLGLLSLVAHFAPDDHAARAAALLHDVGHLPLSHTLETALGVDHHDLGVRAVVGLEPVLEAGGLELDDVLGLAFGPGPSVLRPAHDLMKLDHFESYLRSGQVRGGTRETPATTLSRIHLADGAVEADAATADYLADLVVHEAQYQSSVPNVVANAVVSTLTARLVADWDTDRIDRLARATDHELWAVLRDAPATSGELADFLCAPWEWDAHVLDSRDTAPTGTTGYSIPRFYTAPPVVAGRPHVPPAHVAAALSALPHRFAVARRAPHLTPPAARRRGAGHLPWSP